ncbi:hypothetical protein ESD82_08315 (plasmid) [Paracoccus pantotrophus]|uniref:Transposase n=1 Tax=Paracoccus pantotrophus TaxID=82367 RepID=A0AAE6NUR9_PARPN|nr:hypothetical protein ESD82_08315 [Paracoccus pantotrophus]
MARGYRSPGERNRTIWQSRTIRRPVRPERQVMEQMRCNLLFCWFASLGIDGPAWVLTTKMSCRSMARR